MSQLPMTMTAVEMTGPGGPEVLQTTTRPMPLPGAGEVLIEVAAAGVNRPDIHQREGNYAPPRCLRLAAISARTRAISSSMAAI